MLNFLNCYQFNAKCNNFVQIIIVVFVTNPKSELFGDAIQSCFNPIESQN